MWIQHPEPTGSGEQRPTQICNIKRDIPRGQALHVAGTGRRAPSANSFSLSNDLVAARCILSTLYFVLVGNSYLLG
jgi:hypothetical protein